MSPMPSGHMRTHTSVKPFPCPHSTCSKAFADKSNLRSHLLTHNVKEKTHRCDRCGRNFAQKRYLHKHIQEVCQGATGSPSPATSGAAVPGSETPVAPATSTDAVTNSPAVSGPLVGSPLPDSTSGTLTKDEMETTRASLSEQNVDVVAL